MHIGQLNSNRNAFASNKENIQPFVNLKKQKTDSQRIFGKDVQNTAQLSQPPEKMLIEDLTSARSVVTESIAPRENPQHVLPFQASILLFLKTREPEYAVDPSYLARQPDINARMRGILIDWLVDVNIKFKLLPQTLFMTINVLDRFLSKEIVTRNILQLVGVAALMLVSKYEEIYPPLIKEYMAVCDNAYTKQEILDMEARIIIALEFNLTHTSSFTFLQQLQLQMNIEPKAFAFARYILENALFDTFALKYCNLLLAAGALFLVNKIFKAQNWKASFAQATSIDEASAKACAKDLYAIIQKMDASSLTALKRKFAASEFFEVSKYRIERIQNGNQNN